MSEPKVGFFSRIYYSIVSFEKYRYFLRQSTAKAVIHVLIIAIITCVISFIPLTHEYNKIIDAAITNMDTSVPDFKLSNGRLEIFGDMPIILDGGNRTVIFDTSPNAEDTLLDSYDNLLLITSDKIIQKNYVDKTYTSLEIFQGLELTRQSLKEALPIMKPLGILAFVFLGILFVCGSLISIFVVSVAGLIINFSKGTSLSYRSIYKISAYSLTLPLILIAILGLMPVNILLLQLVYYIIAVIYVFGAINAIKTHLDMYKNIDSFD